VGEKGIHTTTEEANLNEFDVETTIVSGDVNEVVVGFVTDTYVGGFGVFAGLWVDTAIVHIDVSMIYRADLHYGFKYERSPVGTWEEHANIFNSTGGSHIQTAGLNYYISASHEVEITAPYVDIISSTHITLTTTETATPTNTSFLTLSPTSAELDCSGGNSLKIDSTSLTAAHANSVSVGTPACYLQATATGVTVNGPTANINAGAINLGQPVVTSATILQQLAEAQAAAAAEAAEAAEMAATQAAADWAASFGAAE
jgi:hypothetical protein